MNKAFKSLTFLFTLVFVISLASPTFAATKLRAISIQSISPHVYNVVVFGQKEFDTENGDVICNGNQLVVKTPGVYIVTAGFQTYPSDCYVSAYIRVNGSRYSSATTQFSAGSCTGTISETLKLNANDYVEFIVNPDKATSLSGNYTFLSLTRITQ